jgi:hypothetical protein
MGRASRQRAETLFDMRTVAQSFDELLTSVRG